MERYKEYPIYATAEPSDKGAWCAVGIVYAPDPKAAIELKRLHTRDMIIFPTEEEAQEHAVALCKAWIDDFERKTGWKDEIESER
jgi:hypothetical protein